MAKLHNYNGRYCETEYENAFLSFLEEAGWNYLPGSSLPRTSMRDVLYIDDMEYFLNKTNPDLTADEIQQIMDTVRLAGAESDFATLHKVYGWMVNGIQFTPQSGLPIMVNLIDFENPEKMYSVRSISSLLNIPITGRRRIADRTSFCLSTEFPCVLLN